MGDHLRPSKLRDLRPDRGVTAATAGAALGAVVAWVLGPDVVGLANVPSEPLTILGAFVVGWLVGPSR